MNTNISVNSLSNYSSPDYLVGNSTPQALAEVRDRLGHNLEPMPVELSAVEGLIHEMHDTSIRAELEGSGPIPNIFLTEDNDRGKESTGQAGSWMSGPLPDWI